MQQNYFRNPHVTTESENVLMQEHFVGLCVTCNNVSDCSYRSLRKTDAIYCDMFDANHGTVGKANPYSIRTTDYSEEPLESRGLCVNCAHRDTCQISNRQGGVWHCEEYE